MIYQAENWGMKAVRQWFWYHHPRLNPSAPAKIMIKLFTI